MSDEKEQGSMSYYDYDEQDFYEPHGYESQIETLVDAVRKNIKAEVVAELDKLRAENEQLQDVKRRMEDIEHEHKQKLYELDQAKRDALNIVRRERLQQMGEALNLVVYAPKWYRLELPKCDECNDRRRITFTSPSGRILDEECKCSKGPTQYKPEKKVCVEFVSRDGKISAWYKPSDYRDSDHNVSSDHMDRLYDEVPFEQINTYYNSAFFISEEKCQAYCEWLNEKERMKEGLA